MIRLIAVSVAATFLLSCGGSGDDLSGSSSGGSTVTSAASNVAAAVVNSGPSGVNAVNTLFVSLTLCVPGSTTNCQTIDNIQVDTGSSGLRILSSVLTLALPTTTDGNGNTYVECLGTARESGPDHLRGIRELGAGSNHRIVRLHRGARRVFEHRIRGRHGADLRREWDHRGRIFRTGLRRDLREYCR
jgi:hypothetical protein